MKTIEADDGFYSYIVNHTKYIGESTSDTLWCMLKFTTVSQPVTSVTKEARVAPPATAEAEPVKTIKDKVRVTCELLLSNEYAK